MNIVFGWGIVRDVSIALGWEYSLWFWDRPV